MKGSQRMSSLDIFANHPIDWSWSPAHVGKRCENRFGGQPQSSTSEQGLVYLLVFYPWIILFPNFLETSGLVWKHVRTSIYVLSEKHGSRNATKYLTFSFIVGGFTWFFVMYNIGMSLFLQIWHNRSLQRLLHPKWFLVFFFMISVGFEAILGVWDRFSMISACSSTTNVISLPPARR